METKKLKRDVISLHDIPPRVVIFKILSFYEMRIFKRSRLKEFSMFGYFTKDRLRNIWFLFPSIDIEFHQMKFNITSTFMDFSKIQNLFVGCRKVSVIKTLIETLRVKSKSMYSLQKLRLQEFAMGNGNDNEDLEEANRIRTKGYEIFNTPLCFPNLKVLVLAIELPYLQLEDMNGDLFTRIEILRFTPRPANQLQNNFLWKGRSVLNNLKRIFIADCCFKNEFIIYMPKLESIRILRCSNLHIIPGELLISLEYESLLPRDIKDLFLNSKNLVSIEVGKVSTDIELENWFFDRHQNPLKNLKIASFDFAEAFGPKMENFMTDVMKRVTIFHAAGKTWDPNNEYLFNLNFLRESSPKIKGMSFRSINLDCDDVVWPCCENLENLSIATGYFDHNIDHLNPPVSYIFRGVKHYPKLTSLSLSCGFFDGVGWNPLVNLKKLVICSTRIGDEFFSEQDLDFIEFLEIAVDPEELILPEHYISGAAWKKRSYDTLKVFRVIGEVVIDSLFTLIAFPNLEKLRLKNSRLSGNQWKEMKCLKKLYLKRCPLFGLETAQEMVGEGVTCFCGSDVVKFL